MKILVTGGSGFLGKNLVNRLINKYGRDAVLHPDSKTLNLLNYNETINYLAEEKTQLVIHLAAKMAGIGELTINPMSYLQDNLELNNNLVKACLSIHVPKIITMGSSCAYNNETPLPMQESEFWSHKPENTYGICKLILLEHLQVQKKMRWVYLVPGNIYGPGDHFGEENAHLIPATILKFEKAKLEGRRWIDVWGDGLQVRDFIYVDDVSKILCNAIENPDYEGSPINISTGTGHSVKEVVECIREAMGLNEIEIRWDTTKPTGILKKILDNKKVLQIAGNLEFTDFKTGLCKTIEMYLQKKEGRSV